jgi:AcrR family transcriptional regulator
MPDAPVASAEGPWKTRRTSQEWADAALAAMASHGMAGINIEQLARALNTTKGSFYHHFANRRALLEAALVRFESIVTDDLVGAEAVPDPRSRLVQASLAGIDSSIDGHIDLALAASLDDPLVAAALGRINRRRIDYISGVLAEMGVPADQCHSRAIGGLATYLGLYHWQRVADEPLGRDELKTQIIRAIDTMAAS